jgi:hypothetical protein
LLDCLFSSGLRENEELVTIFPANFRWLPSEWSYLPGVLQDLLFPSATARPDWCNSRDLQNVPHIGENQNVPLGQNFEE